MAFRISKDEDKKGFDSENSKSINKEEVSGSVSDFLIETPERQIEDLIIPEHTKTKLTTAINRIEYNSIIYETLGISEIDPTGGGTAINLFGPPGTGKSLASECIASRFNKSLIRVNYADIESKYVGDTPKNITKLFKKAKENDAVIFFDEADSILGKRLSNVTQSADHSVNVTRSTMLLQLDRFDGIVLFATNLARNYDPAFTRRILSHIEIPVPDADTRKRLWQKMIPTKLPLSDDVSPDWLTENSEGLTGGDLKNVIITAASVIAPKISEAPSVTREIILGAIEDIRKAKKEIGNTDDSVEVKTRKISMEEYEAEKNADDKKHIRDDADLN